MAETFSPRRCRPAFPRACPLRRGDLLFRSAAKRTPGLPFGCAAKRSAEILTDSHFLPSIPGVGNQERKWMKHSWQEKDLATKGCGSTERTQTATLVSSSQRSQTADLLFAADTHGETLVCNVAARRFPPLPHSSKGIKVEQVTAEGFFSLLSRFVGFTEEAVAKPPAAEMGRMHSRGKGISGSALPYKRTPASWLKISPPDVGALCRCSVVWLRSCSFSLVSWVRGRWQVEENICKFAKKGLTPSQIGVILRDSHGVAQVKSVTGNKILRILKAHGLAPEIPEDMYHLIKKAVSVRKHLERNRKDKDSKFRLILVESRIHRLARYYKRTKKLPPRVYHSKHTRRLEFADHLFVPSETKGKKLARRETLIVRAQSTSQARMHSSPLRCSTKFRIVMATQHSRIKTCGGIFLFGLEPNGSPLKKKGKTVAGADGSLQDQNRIRGARLKNQREPSDA
ncbi:hypothetical protein Taro_030197 [Colocasia esculenta]|uniref:Small ribosomal subunit protein uS15 N-terminal domain-containing protein n=1 Tax=Colocasia esculenta TaxID=4460 RepID=A0A843VTF2_COLES|nr:hypothetical protein [Colocasia esculenta]